VTDPADVLAGLPRGVGLLNLGGDRVTVVDNVALGNDSAGIAIGRLPAALAGLDPRVDPLPDGVVVRGNAATGNGGAPDPKLTPLPGADLLWDGTGAGNCWAGNAFRTAFPPALPACS
jgi:hypothetical protein